MITFIRHFPLVVSVPAFRFRSIPIFLEFYLPQNQYDLNTTDYYQNWYDLNITDYYQNQYDLNITD